MKMIGRNRFLRRTGKTARPEAGATRLPAAVLALVCGVVVSVLWAPPVGAGSDSARLSALGLAALERGDTSRALELLVRAADGTNAVLEFSCKGTSHETGARYDQDYVSVLDLREGLISRYRDYWNPLTVLEAMGGADSANAALKGNPVDT